METGSNSASRSFPGLRQITPHKTAIVDSDKRCERLQFLFTLDSRLNVGDVGLSASDLRAAAKRPYSERVAAFEVYVLEWP